MMHFMGFFIFQHIAEMNFQSSGGNLNFPDGNTQRSNQQQQSQTKHINGRLLESDVD